MKRLLLTIINLASILYGVAQPTCHVRTFTIRNGLAANSISSMEEDSRGLVWVSTWNGLCYFDGHEFHTFRSAGWGSDDDLSTNRLAGLRCDNEGNLWLRTYDGQLYLFNTSESRFHNVGRSLGFKDTVTISPRNIYPVAGGHTWIIDAKGNKTLRTDDRHAGDTAFMEVYGTMGKRILSPIIKKVETDVAGHEWIFTDKGVCLYGSNMQLKGSFEYMASISGKTYLATTDGKLFEWSGKGSARQQPLPKEVTAINQLAIYHDNRLVIATDQGLVSGGRLVTHRPVSELHIDSHNRIWLFGPDEGVTLTDIDGKEVRHLAAPQADNGTRCDRPVWIEDKQMTIWMVPKGGVFSYYDEQTEQLVACPLQQAANGLLNLPIMEKVMIDSQNNLWFSSPEGLTLVNLRYSHLHILPLVERQSTRSLLCRHDGTVWAGSQDGFIGIYAHGRQQGWLAPDGSISQQPVAFAHRIYALFEDSRHRLWVGTKGRGAWCVDKTVTHYEHSDSDAYSLSHNFVYDFDEDMEGNIYIATYGGGINIMAKDNEGRFIHLGNRLRQYPKDTFLRLRRVTHDQMGTMVLSSTEGLLTFSSTGIATSPEQTAFYPSVHDMRDTTTLRTNDIEQTLITKRGQVFVVTMGGGIQQLASGSLTDRPLRFATIECLNRNVSNVLSMTEDDDENIWIVREPGIERYTPQTGMLLQLGPDKMQDVMSLGEAKSVMDQEHHLWVAGRGGVVMLNIGELHESRYCPPIVFTNVQYQGELTSHPILNLRCLRLTPEHRTMTIHFAALDYEDSRLMQYAYRMDDAEEWNYISEPQIAFSELSPGEHRLTVRSTNCDGVWVGNDTELIIQVEPTFMERTGVRVLLALLLLVLLSGAIQLYLHRRRINARREERLQLILKQYRELQEQVENEGKAAQDANAAAAAPKREYALSEPKIVNEDEVFMDKLMKFIEEHIDDDGLRIDDMAEAVNMGRTMFYENVRRIVGLSPSDFLRQVRMQRARQLIVKSRQSVAQIAYSVGFTDPKYFTKCFKKDTGMTPSEYKEKMSEG